MFVGCEQIIDTSNRSKYNLWLLVLLVKNFGGNIAKLGYPKSAILAPKLM
jgi:hypothetical protein